MVLSLHLRRLAAPLAAAAYPLLFFAYRESGTSAPIDQSVTVLPLGPVVPVRPGIVAGVLAGVVVGAAIWTVAGRLPSWARSLSVPSDGTILVFAGLSLGFWASLAVGLPDALSAWGRFAVEVVFLWPMVLLYVGMILLGNAVFGEPSLAVQFVVVGVGIALSAAWLFLLSGWVVHLLRRVTS